VSAPGTVFNAPGEAAVSSLPHTDADFVARISVTGRLLDASSNVAQVLGWDLAPDNLYAGIPHEDDRATTASLVAQLLRTGHVRATVRVHARDRMMWLDVAARRLADGPQAEVYVSARDVSDDVLAMHHLSAAEQQWRVAFENSPIGGALLAADGSIVLTNDALIAMLGRPRHEFAHLNILDVFGGDSGLGADSRWQEFTYGRSVHYAGDIRCTTLDGTTVWCRLTAAAVPAYATGSRRLMLQWLTSALEEHAGQSVGVLYVDVDRFKLINDSLGHAAGDELLGQLAARVRQALRPDDFIGRVGGDGNGPDARQPGADSRVARGVGYGRWHRSGRFRHWLLLAEPVAPVPGEHREDRPELRGAPVDRPQRAGDRPRGRRHVPAPRAFLGGRGHRNPRTARRPDRARVHPWPRLPAGAPRSSSRRLAGQRMIAHVASTEFASSEVIRPAAVLSDSHARLILAGLAADDVQAGGHWWTRVGVWRRYAGPWSPGADGPGSAIQLGTVSCVYDSPSRYSVTVFRVSLTIFGLHQGLNAVAVR